MAWGNPKILNSIFKENQADVGGALYQPNGATVLNSTISGNRAGFFGGGLWVGGGGPEPVLISGCTIHANEATSAAGGGIAIFNADGSIDISIVSSTISDNVAAEGGGIRLWHLILAGATLSDNLICGNAPDNIRNAWTDNGGNVLAESCLGTCPGDLDGNGAVNGADLGLLLAVFGSADPAADLDGDGSVNGADLGLLLAAWGAPCP